MSQERDKDPEVDELMRAAETLGLRLGELVRQGAARNAVGVQSDHVLFSRRLDSRTYFVQDDRYGVGAEAGHFEGPGDEILQAARGHFERLGLPAQEIGEAFVAQEHGQTAEVDRSTGAVRMGEVERGRGLAQLNRQIDRLPVWSSRMLLGLTKDGSIGLLELHWPEIPEVVLPEARRMAEMVEKGWEAPKHEGATVESVEAGIIHSPAAGFYMDILPVIRVVYAPTDPTIGRKPVIYFDRHGNPAAHPRQIDLPNEERLPPRQAGPEGPIDRHRSDFRAFLLGNPNYFGNLPQSPFKPQVQIAQNTTYESIGCVGYEPRLRRLDAIVYLHRSTGYGGNICSAGTPEFVRFYLSYDGGTTWHDQGLASFTANDVPGTTRLEFDVAVTAHPVEQFCNHESLPLARAILSWNFPPPAANPGFIPVWGQVKDVHIQVSPLVLPTLGTLLQEAKLQLPQALAEIVDTGQTVALAPPSVLAAADLHKLYQGADVPGHRYLHPDLSKWVDEPAGTTISALEVGGGLAGLDLDLAAIVQEFLGAQEDTSFEQLTCVGLHPNDSRLSGVLEVKKPSGYSGPLCSAGSYEYVAFWIDYGSGLTYVGTTSVNVHDVAKIPLPGGLSYSAVLPVPDLVTHRQPCEKGPRVLRVRAILSWQTPPPPSNPDYVPRWGNRVETLVVLPPGPTVTDQVPLLSAVGDIPYTHIDGGGRATGSAIHTGFLAADSPFGGRITIAGHISNPTGGLKYRLMRKPHGAPDSAYVPLTREPTGLTLTINTWNVITGWSQTDITFHADPQGYYPFEDFSSVHSVEGNIMGIWDSTDAEDALTFDLRIDLSVDGIPAHDVYSNVVSVLVDNTAPDVGLTIDLGTGVQCADFDEGTTFTGHFHATDSNFGSYSFDIQPSGPPHNPTHGVLPHPSGGVSVHYGGAVTDPGVATATYTLNTGHDPGPPDVGPMDHCGYALILHAWDRTNVNSGAGSHHSQAPVGFCIKVPTS